MREDRFPPTWVPSPENRDLRQLLWHLHRMVQMRTRIMNQLQALAMNEGKRWKSKLFSQPGRAEFEKLALAPWASRRRRELLELLDRLNPSIEELTTAAEQEVNKRPEALRLMTHPGVGPITALAYVLIIGTPERFARGEQIGTHGGLQSGQTTARTHQQTGQLAIALLAGGGRAGSHTLQSALAASLPAPGDAAAQEHREGSDGSTDGDSVVLDVAERM